MLPFNGMAVEISPYLADDEACQIDGVLYMNVIGWHAFKWKVETANVVLEIKRMFADLRRELLGKVNQP